MPSYAARGVDSAEHHLVQSGRAAFANYSGHIIGGRAAERLAVVRERAVTERASVSSRSMIVWTWRSILRRSDLFMVASRMAQGRHGNRLWVRPWPQAWPCRRSSA